MENGREKQQPVTNWSRVINRGESHQATTGIRAGRRHPSLITSTSNWQSSNLLLAVVSVSAVQRQTLVLEHVKMTVDK